MSDDKKGPGRPPVFKPEYTAMLLEYFNVRPYARKTREELKRDENGNCLMDVDGHLVTIEVEDGAPEANDFPSLAGFATKIGHHRETLLEWSKDPEKLEFSDAYKMAKEFQENFLLVNGLKGIINTSFGQFVAKNVLGYRDKQPGETDVSVNVNNTTTINKDTPDDVLERRKAELEAKYREEVEARVRAELAAEASVVSVQENASIEVEETEVHSDTGQETNSTMEGSDAGET